MIRIAANRLIAACLTLAAAAMHQPAWAEPVPMAFLQDRARQACMGAPVIPSSAIVRHDLDGDGQEDVLFIWSDVTCANSRSATGGAGNCGMHNCSVDIYLTSTWRPGKWPTPVLNHAEYRPETFSDAGGAGLRTHISGGSCSFARFCVVEWRWDGNKLVAGDPVAPGSSASALPEGELEPETATIAGNWVEQGDGCASDAGWQFTTDGDYYSYGEKGDWRLIGPRIAIMVRETFEMGDETSHRRIAEPEPQVWRVISLTRTSMRLVNAQGTRVSLRRCAS